MTPCRLSPTIALISVDFPTPDDPRSAVDAARPDHLVQVCDPVSSKRARDEDGNAL
jgi:hypothetical protein